MFMSLRHIHAQLSWCAQYLPADYLGCMRWKSSTGLGLKLGSLGFNSKINRQVIEPCSFELCTIIEKKTTTNVTVLSLVPCPPGTFRNSADWRLATQCVHCPRHMYQPEAGQQTCLNCPDGTGTYDVGSLSYADCKREFCCFYSQKHFKTELIYM